MLLLFILTYVEKDQGHDGGKYLGSRGPVQYFMLQLDSFESQGSQGLVAIGPGRRVVVSMAEYVKLTGRYGHDGTEQRRGVARGSGHLEEDILIRIEGRIEDTRGCNGPMKVGPEMGLDRSQAEGRQRVKEGDSVAIIR